MNTSHVSYYHPEPLNPLEKTSKDVKEVLPAHGLLSHDERLITVADEISLKEQLRRKCRLIR